MDDLISRQAAIDAIEKHLNGVLGERDYDEGIVFGYQAAHRHIQAVIAQLPSAQKTGTWIDRQEGKWIYAKCNICGTTWDAKSNYCPNCGAKMEATDHGNDQ